MILTIKNAIPTSAPDDVAGRVDFLLYPTAVPAVCRLEKV